MGIVFDIQRFSISDGPGIRTTVFLKGCNLRCAWCHNPESVSPEPQRMDGELYGKEMSCLEVMETVCRDAAFYQNSGGGMTLSGGEPLLQPEFALELLKWCREEQIHTVVDTAGNVPYAVFEKIIPYTDLFLFDLKAVSPELHREGTGVDNQLILENLQRLDVPKWIRIPVIPSYNDNQKELEAMAERLQDVPKVERICLLPFHRLGFAKYRKLGVLNPCGGLREPGEEEMKQHAKVFSACSAVVTIE